MCLLSNFLFSNLVCFWSCHFFSLFSSLGSRPASDSLIGRSIKEHGGNRQHSCLDDTASSPVISFTKATSLQKNLKKEASQGFSGTHFKVFKTVVFVFHFYLYFFQPELKLNYMENYCELLFQGKSAFQKKIGFMKSGKDAGSKDAGFSLSNFFFFFFCI